MVPARHLKDDTMSRYWIAPAENPTDRYAAGYDDNSFASLEEAEGVIAGLRALGEEWDCEWVVHEACESGDATGQRCDRVPTECVEWMPEHLRESHRAAGNSGQWPMNGAMRLRVCPRCAEMLSEDIGGAS